MAKKSTTHYSAEDWVDFVMEQASQERMTAMKNHLGSGCRQCSGLAGLWARVNTVASRGISAEPPASAVRHVEQVFAIAAEARREQRPALIPRLVFDSSWQPAMAGVRSGSTTPHRVLYKTRDVSIEMHLEPAPRSERVNISGQITIDGHVEVAPIAVFLKSNKGKVASTTTNRFGEFHLAFIPEPGLRISFGMTEGEEVLVPLEGSGLKVFYRS
ncbi:MAG TPA: hypothetical protein VGI16_05420 [Candidatus Acidoferrum sp.]|jgi:hypothetical protein